MSEPTDPPPSPPPFTAGPDLPTAVLRRERGVATFWPWLIPAVVLVVAAVLAVQSLGARGPRLSLSFRDGHGLKLNDPVVYRGVQVGRIRGIAIDRSAQRVSVEVELTRDAAFLKSQGCFWIVRPEVSISRISGIETLFGPRYIAAAVLPAGESSPVARDTPPPFLWTAADPLLEDGGLLVNVRAPRAGSVAVGSPVSFRETPVGTVVAVTLAPDGRSVVMTAAIRGEFAHLVRSNSVFWNVSGIGLDLGLVGGLKLKAESLQTIFAGGLAFATPDKPGEPVGAGAEFAIAEFDSEYLRWSPVLRPAVTGTGK
jgi:paraquat-inducible protein B